MCVYIGRTVEQDAFVVHDSKILISEYHMRLILLFDG